MTRDEMHRTKAGNPSSRLQGGIDSSDERTRAIPDAHSADEFSRDDGIDRRGFLTLMGASLALAGLTGCRRPEEHIVPYVSKPEDITLGIPQRYATSMPFDTESFTLLVESHEGRPTRIGGNAMNPRTGTATNAWASASILELYDPDRARTVRTEGRDATMQEFAAAWAGMHAEFSRTGGQGLALLREPYASPTLNRLSKLFAAAFPNARVATYAPVSGEHILEGIRIATGSALEPVVDLEKADVVLSLDADFLGTEPRQVVNLRAFANHRGVRQEQDAMNRLYLVESTLSQTSAMADHRRTVQASLIGGVAAAVARALQARGLDMPELKLAAVSVPGIDDRWISALADDLLAHKGSSLVLAGRRQPPGVHALAVALNAALGNHGRTVSYAALPHAAHSDSASLAELVRDMNAGVVKTLVILGGNPVYNAPADSGFAAAMQKVSASVHFAGAENETSARCAWLVPRLHFLESWGDVSSLDGHLGVVQPLIAPLFDGLSDVEMLHLLATGTEAKGYDLVAQTWRALVPGGEAAFRRVLHDGLLPAPLSPAAVAANGAAVTAHLTAHPLPVTPAWKDRLEIVYAVSPAVHDGRFANNGWLQEFPDPVTKLTWDNAAILSRDTADVFGVGNGDLVRLSLEGRDLVLPVWIMPGQAEFSVAIALGYGRTAAGRVGTGTGFNAYRLRTVVNAGFAVGATLVPLREQYALACVQAHHGLDGDAMAEKGLRERLPVIVREGTLAEYRKKPEFAKERVEMPELRSMWDDHQYTEGHQWAMSIDLNACIGCGVCTIACQSENNIPIVGKKQVLNGREMHWIRVDRYFAGTHREPVVMTQPMACVQCEMAPCEQVCPVAATSHDSEGLNAMAYNRCIGTRYCSNNCPFKVRRFNFFNYTKDYPELLQMAQNPEVTVRFRGVMEKCTYCTQRINTARIAAKREERPLRDGDIVTACEEACPASAIVFGDGNDPGSRVAQRKRENRDYAVLGEFNVRPRTTYLARLRNPNPALGGGAA